MVIPIGDGTVPFVDAVDIAAVAVAALTEDGLQEQVYELSGPRAMTFADAVGEIASATVAKSPACRWNCPDSCSTW